MKNLIQTLKDTTLGDALEPVRDISMLNVVLSFTGVCSILQLFMVLAAKMLGDRDTADRSLNGAFMSLLLNVLLTAFSTEPDMAEDGDRDA